LSAIPFADLEEQYLITRTLWKDKTIADRVFYKMTVMTAHLYILHGFAKEANGLLTTIPSSYMLGTISEDLEADSDFMERAHELATKLVEAGLVDEEKGTDESAFVNLAMNTNKVGKA
jgi:hypothetical protein